MVNRLFLIKKFIPLSIWKAWIHPLGVIFGYKKAALEAALYNQLLHPLKFGHKKSAYVKT